MKPGTFSFAVGSASGFVSVVVSVQRRSCTSRRRRSRPGRTRSPSPAPVRTARRTSSCRGRPPVRHRDDRLVAVVARARVERRVAGVARRVRRRPSTATGLGGRSSRPSNESESICRSPSSAGSRRGAARSRSRSTARPGVGTPPGVAQLIVASSVALCSRLAVARRISFAPSSIRPSSATIRRPVVDDVLRRRLGAPATAERLLHAAQAVRRRPVQRAT